MSVFCAHARCLIWREAKIVPLTFDLLKLSSQQKFQVIRPTDMSLRPGAVSFPEKWSGLQATISSVVQLKRVKMLDWNDHYSDIYALCEAFPESFADKLYKETEKLLQKFVGQLQHALSNQDAHHLMLSSYQRHWLNYQQGVKYLDNLFGYFNRVSLRKYKTTDETTDYNLPVMFLAPVATPPPGTPVEIRHMALRVWKESMIEKVKEPLVKALLQEIRRARDQQTSDLTMVRDVVASLVEVEEYNKSQTLDYYQEVFEAPFLTETGQYYRQQASKLVAESTCSEYMHCVVSMLQTARRRGTTFLHQTSVTKFVRECEARLVEDYKVDYLYAHVREMVTKEKRHDLSNLFILLNGIPKALNPVIDEFQEHVENLGNSSLSKLLSEKNPSVAEFMSTVLSIHKKFSLMIKEVFGSHKLFINALDKACTTFVNTTEKPKQHPKAPLLLARYCDQLLRKSSKGLGEQEVEEKLEKAITIFRYVEDKDMFQRFYSRMLSRRLVQGLSLSMEAEESMIQKLKHACGYEYTARLQRMVVDIKLSSDSVTEFQEQLKTTGNSLPISFSTLVLQSAAWPLVQTPTTLLLPDVLTNAIKKFELFHLHKHTGRKLAWLHHMSIGEIKTSYLKKPYTVCVTTFQMVTLLSFNAMEQHSFHSLLQSTQLGEQDLLSTVQSLVDCKILLLEQESTSEEQAAVGTSCVVKLNKAYSNKRTKFKVTAPLQKDTQQEIEQTQYNVQEDRKLHIQAAIVRVMKARKTLQHNRLIEETISQVRSRFTPNVQMIKRCIETLIDKLYLERSEESKDSYNYVA